MSHEHRVFRLRRRRSKRPRGGLIEMAIQNLDQRFEAIVADAEMLFDRRFLITARVAVKISREIKTAPARLVWQVVHGQFLRKFHSTMTRMSSQHEQAATRKD